MDIALIMRALERILLVLNLPVDDPLRAELAKRAAEIEGKTKLLADAIMRDDK